MFLILYQHCVATQRSEGTVWKNNHVLRKRDKSVRIKADDKSGRTKADDNIPEAVSRCKSRAGYQNVIVLVGMHRVSHS